MAKLTYFKKNQTISRKFFIEIPIEILNIFQHTEQLVFSTEEKTAVFSDIKTQTIQPIFVALESEYIDYMNTSLIQDSLIIVTSNDSDKYQIEKYNFLPDSYFEHHLIYTQNEAVDYIFCNEFETLLVPKSALTTIVLKSLTFPNDNIEFIGHSEPIFSVFFLEKARLLASTSEDKTVKIWNIEQKQCFETIQFTEICYNVLLLNSTKLVGWDGDPMLWVWDLEKKNFLWKKNKINPVVIKPYNIGNNEFILVGQEEGIVDCYFINNGEILWSTFFT